MVGYGGFFNLDDDSTLCHHLTHPTINKQHYQGSRYSFGYPACPNMLDQYVQLDLLDTKRIGMFMDESEQIYPEQSTSALICYHPVAKYFSA